MSTMTKRVNPCEIPFSEIRELFSARAKVGRNGLSEKDSSITDVRVRLPPAEGVAIGVMSQVFGSAKAVEGKILIIEGMRQVMRQYPDLAEQAKQEIIANGLPVPEWLKDL